MERSLSPSLKTTIDVQGGRLAVCVNGAALDKGGILQRPRALQQARSLGVKLFYRAAEG
jgi:hypothetical protein